MLEFKYLDTNTWVEDIKIDSYIYKMFPHSFFKGITIFKSYTGHNPDVSNLIVFGSTAWVRIPLDKRKYLEPQSIECILIGYAE